MSRRRFPAGRGRGVTLEPAWRGREISNEDLAWWTRLGLLAGIGDPDWTEQRAYSTTAKWLWERAKKHHGNTAEVQRFARDIEQRRQKNTLLPREGLRPYSAVYEGNAAVIVAGSLGEARRTFRELGGAPEKIQLYRIRCLEMPSLEVKETAKPGCVFATWALPK